MLSASRLALAVVLVAIACATTASAQAKAPQFANCILALNNAKFNTFSYVRTAITADTTLVTAFKNPKFKATVFVPDNKAVEALAAKANLKVGVVLSSPALKTTLRNIIYNHIVLNTQLTYAQLSKTQTLTSAYANNKLYVTFANKVVTISTGPGGTKATIVTTASDITCSLGIAQGITNMLIPPSLATPLNG